MTPPLRPIPPLLNFATLRWGSSSRLRAFHIQRYLSNDTKSANEEFADRHRHWILERRELLARLSFPRKYMPIWKATWWTARRFPWVLIVLIFSVVRVGLRRAWNPRYWKNHGVLVTSHAGCFFYKAVQDHLDLLNTMMQPWGYISISCGPSMLPTVSAEPAIHYSSYAYTNKRDVKRGDVVMVIGRNYNKWDGQGTMGKRVAALGGERIRVNTSTALRIPHQIIQVPLGHCFLVGGNPSKSTDSRTFGSLPIESIWAKARWSWGFDGFYWVNHHQHPWLENKAIEHLSPNVNRTDEGGGMTTQPKTSPTVVPRLNVKPLPSPAPPKKQPEAKEQQKVQNKQKTKKSLKDSRKKR